MTQFLKAACVYFAGYVAGWIVACVVTVLTASVVGVERTNEISLIWWWADVFKYSGGTIALYCVYRKMPMCAVSVLVPAVLTAAMAALRSSLFAS